MHYLDLLGKTNHCFAIEWESSTCLSSIATSKNISLFLVKDLFRNNEFEELIIDEVDRSNRQTTTRNLEKYPSASMNYILKGCDNNHLYVREEIIFDNGKYISIFTNMTSLHRQNERLGESRERLELVLEGTRLGMWDWNPQTNEVTFDERWADMLGVKLSDLSQTLSDWQDRVHPDDIEGCFADISDHIEGKVDFYENTHRMLHKDGSWRYILDRGRVVKRDSEGHAIRFTGTHTDVTKLKLAEEEARKALISRNKFFARMSHEIRTPLHGILGTADILARMNLNDEQLNLINIINESGASLKTLLDDILDISRIDEGAVSFSIEETNILPSVKRVFKLFGEQAQQKGLSYRYNQLFDDSTIVVKTDPNRIHQIFSNVIANAIKFTDHGFVEVSIEKCSQELIVSITDSGIGIANVSTIYDAYEQEGSAESKQLGTGLGLSIVKSLCEKLNIALTCDTVLGEGTRFTFNLGKILSNSEIEESQCKSRDSLPTILPTAKVLVVDDHGINLFIAKTLLKEFFHHVDTAIDGRQAVAMVAEQQDYDLVFMDMNMPEMDGIEATGIINQLPLEKRPTIIAQTADAAHETVLKFRDKQVEYVITKPFTQDKLNTILSTISDNLK